MRSLYIYIFLCLLIIEPTIAQGLKFSGNEQPIDKRTSLEVFKNKSISFNDNFEIDFYLALDYETRVGHILRIKGKKDDRIYNLLYEGHGGHCVFRFNEEGRSSLIVTEINRSELVDSKWVKIKIAFDLSNDFVELSIQDHKFKVQDLLLPKVYKPEIIFGKSDYIIDVPSFSIKNLSIGNNENKYIFPLKENEGNTLHGSQGESLGEVSNPEWLINDAYRWKQITSASSQSVAGSNYNEQSKEIYYFNRDSIFIFNTKTNEAKTVSFRERCPVELVLATNYIDTKRNKLYVYEVYYNKPYSESTIASLDLNTYEWKVESHDQLQRELHHHGAFYNTRNNELTIFGGYGNNMYSNDFYSYNPDSIGWTKLAKFGGDIIFPRYFLSTAYDEKENSAYIFGGMGNETGEHIVGRKYLYDLYKVNFDTKAIAKLWQTSWEGDKVVPARNLVLYGDSYLYALCYPEHVSESFLKLYQFSLKDGAYCQLGDSIPIYSDKITTNAKLYYDEQLSSLFAIVQESRDDIASDVKVYSLAFPPVSAEELGNYPRGSKNSLISIILLSSVICSIVGYCIYRRYRRQQMITPKLTIQYSSKEKERMIKPNSIYFFGEFAVYDRLKKDVTHLFSAQLKQVFCLIIEQSNEDGITSQRLSNILWPEKPEDKVKNSRGVTINYLRKALSELDGIELVYNKGYFRIVESDNFYCDYSKCIQIISSADNIERNKEELLTILNRGKFLEHLDHPLFDSIKASIESHIEQPLLAEIEKSHMAKTYSTTIELAKAIFNLDSLNDSALSYQIKALLSLKMEDEARLRYMSFVAEYKKTMGDNYPHSFQDLS